MKQQLLELAYKAKFWNIFRPMAKNRLMVLNYHRINYPYDATFTDFVPNVSATPELFASQMDHLIAQGFNFVSQQDVLAWMDDAVPLPPYAVLITFDDGYEDNYSIAYPILQQRNIPATIFLSTDYIGSSAPFYWDLVAFCLFKSPIKKKNLPLLGIRQWEDDDQRISVTDEFVKNLKLLSEDEKSEIVFTLPSLLEVQVNESDFIGKHLDWDQVREMSNNLITFGGHTKSHPILTRISLERAGIEITESKRKIEKELSCPIESMAYPNGGEADFSPAIMKIVEDAGFRLAFSLIDGYHRFRNLNQNRFELRRIYLGKKDKLPRFAAKTSPFQNWL